MNTTICVISDTHGRHADLVIPPCDILIHCGDICVGLDPHIQANYVNGVFLPWFDSQPAAHKVFIAGNHDFAFADCPDNISLNNYLSVHYLRDNSITLGGLRFWGSPWTPWFFDWAFNAPRDRNRANLFFDKLYSLVPSDTDIIVTHGPPLGVFDNGVGSYHLLSCVERVRPKACVFGHIHEGYGSRAISGTFFANAAVLDAHYELVNAPIVFHLDVQEH
jgi:Icc-related predicted phosphoesterase